MTFWYILMIGIMIAGFGGLSDKINKVMRNLPASAKKEKAGFPSLKELTGKRVELTLDDDDALLYGFEAEGILKEYNSAWLVLETFNKEGKRVLYYYRINNISSVNILEKEG